jgi:zinc protease
MNYRLGGGSFCLSAINTAIREGKGYTYGIGSSFTGSTLGPFATIVEFVLVFTCTDQ